MLAGLGESDTGRAHAEELLATADSEKAHAVGSSADEATSAATKAKGTRKKR